MAVNNFLITTGNVYISKAGDNANAGTMDAPKKTIQAATLTNIYVVGAGVYDSVDVGSTATGQYIGDGTVKIVAPGGQTASFGGRDMSFSNIYFERVNFGSQVAAATKPVTNCFFRRCGAMATGNAGRIRTFSRCIFVSTSMGNTQAGHLGTVTFSLCIGISSYIAIYGSTGLFMNNFMDRDSTVLLRSASPANFGYNNIRGIVLMPRATGLSPAMFVIQDQLVGTPQDNGYPASAKWMTEANMTASGVVGTIAGWNARVALCMNRDPKFINIEEENFNLQADSPHLRAASDGSNNIGGTPLGITVYNTDDGNDSGTRVLPGPTIDTTVGSAWRLADGETEGYVDYVVKGQAKKILKLTVDTIYQFNSDAAGATPDNNNVPDSHPLTASYAQKTLTTVAAANTSEVVVATGIITVGQWIRVNGQARLVATVTPDGLGNDSVAFASALLALIGVGVTVTYGTEVQLAALNPNRLTYQLRTKNTATPPTIPFVDAEWDNEVSPIYGVAGVLFDQMVDTTPGLIISGGVVYGPGDPATPSHTITNFLYPEWAHIRVYLRNNYSSNGL